MITTRITTTITTMIIMMTTTQDRYNSEESLEEENQSTTSSTESRQSDFAKKDDGFIPTRRSDQKMSMKYKNSNKNQMHREISLSVQTHSSTRPAPGYWRASLQATLDSSQGRYFFSSSHYYYYYYLFFWTVHKVDTSFVIIIIIIIIISSFGQFTRYVDTSSADCDNNGGLMMILVVM